MSENRITTRQSLVYGSNDTAVTSSVELRGGSTEMEFEIAGLHDVFIKEVKSILEKQEAKTPASL